MFVFVHGYRVVFTNPVLVSAQLWHFLGYRGAFIAYAWPSTPRGLAYLSDIETAKSMARKLRLFLTFLADSTRARRIHIIGYSAGSRLVVRALEQLALQYDELSEDELHQRLRIGTVVLTAADMSREGFGTAVLDGVLTVPERTIVYMSSNDQALALSRRLFKRERLGEVWTDQLPPRQRRSMRARADLELIDVTGAPGTTTGTGHAYFRDSPWVSSDLLAALGDGLGAADRGLVHDDERLVWTFPPDYVERAQRARMALK